MRKTAITLALAGGALLPLTGVAHALDNANTYGRTTGTSTVITTNPKFTCNPTAPTKATDAFCRLALAGTHQETNTIFGKTHGTYTGKLTLDYTYAAATQSTCAAVSGQLTLKLYNNSNQAIGSTTVTVRPATTADRTGSKACNTGQSASDSDVGSLYLIGKITGSVGGFPACGDSESKGSTVRNRNSSGTLTGVSRDTSNLQANLLVGEPCTSTS